MNVPFSFSQLKTYKRCPWLYDKQYNVGIRRISTRLTIATGDFIHKLLYGLYAKADWQKEWGCIKNEYQDGQLFEGGAEEIAGLAERVYGIMERYEREVYLAHDTDLTILHMEEELPVSHKGVEFIIKPDLVVRDKQGLVWLIDHKTTTDFKDDTETALRYDDQVSLYLWGLRERGLDVMGATHNLIRTRLPNKPEVTQKGLLSRQKITTDEGTVRAAVEEYRAKGISISDQDLEGYLAMMKMSVYFKRVTTFRSDEILDRLIGEYMMTRSDIDRRNVDGEWTRTFIPRDCPRCALRELCLTDLQGGDTESLMETTYRLRGEENPAREVPEELIELV